MSCGPTSEGTASKQARQAATWGKSSVNKCISLLLIEKKTQKLIGLVSSNLFVDRNQHNVTSLCFCQRYNMKKNLHPIELMNDRYSANMASMVGGRGRGTGGWWWWWSTVSSLPLRWHFPNLYHLVYCTLKVPWRYWIPREEKTKAYSVAQIISSYKYQVLTAPLFLFLLSCMWDSKAQAAVPFPLASLMILNFQDQWFLNLTSKNTHYRVPPQTC